MEINNVSIGNGDSLNILIFDDDRERIHSLTKQLAGHNVFSTVFYDKAVDYVESGPRFDVMFLDHDLGHWVDNFKDPSRKIEWTGFDFVKRILEEPKERWPKRVIVHSWNPDGAKRMHTTLIENGIPTESVTFKDRLLSYISLL